MKKLFTVLFALLLLLALSAPAEGNLRTGTYFYRVLPDDTIEITQYVGKDKIVSIPSRLFGKDVTSIGDCAFESCYDLNTVTIPGSVKNIGNYAFNDCKELVVLNLSEGLEIIGDGAFSWCDRLTAVTLPDSITSIGVNPFGVGSLTDITVSPEHEYLAVIDGVLFSKPDKRLVYCPIDKEGGYEIPTGIRIIGKSAFDGCRGLTSIMLPDSVTIIEDDAFSFCFSLSSVTIPASVMEIGENAFYGCAEGEIVITVEKGSYAEEYCMENGLKYVYPEA